MKYVSRKRELILVEKPIDRTVDEHRRVQILPGKKVQFFGGMYETNDPEIMDFLHNHPLRKNLFDEITEKEIAVIKKPEAIPMAQGVQTSSTISDVRRPEKVEVVASESTVRPTDTAAISPELVRIIDERIQSALGTIINLLDKQDKKEKQVMGEEKPKKTFKCPYCGDTNFNSPFTLGAHKKNCPEKK